MIRAMSWIGATARQLTRGGLVTPIALGMGAVLACGAPATAQAPPAAAGSADADAARELMRQVQEMAAAPHEIIELTMSLTDSAGTTRQRETTIYQKQRETGRMARVTRFHTPPEMAGAGVLALENIDRDDDWWIYLPAYHTTRRIAAANRGDTYMGTDFSYEDLTDLRLDDYEFSLSGWAEVESTNCRVIEARPQAPSLREQSLYSRRVYYVDPVRHICPRVVLYGRDGQPLKEARSSQPITAGERWRWERTELHNVRTGHSTVIEVRERRWEESIPDRIFTERALRRPG
jgi:uncharacterized protein